MPAYCPTCRGLLRPQHGSMVCIRCSAAARARTVVAKGRRIHLADGQQGLMPSVQAVAAAAGVDPTLEPRDPSWKPGHAGSPHPQLGLFPYDEVRDGQLRLARDVTLAVQAGRHLVAQAPTGIGKTAAALAPALQHALAAKKTVLFLTSRKSQHRIAVETLRLVQERRGVGFALVDLVAKRDMCLRAEASQMHPARFPDFCALETRTKSCRYLGDVDPDTLRQVRGGVLHVEELMAVAKRAHLCPHLVALAAAKDCQVVVADYNHLFSDIRERSLERLGLRLDDLIVIVDEAHNLPERIRQSHSHRVTPFLLDAVEREAAEAKAREVEGDLAALRKALETLAARAAKDGSARPARLGDESAQVAPLGIDDLHAAFEHHRGRGLLSGRRTLDDLVEGLGKAADRLRKGSDAVVHSEQLADALEDWGRFRDGALRYLRFDGGSVELHVRLLDAALPARGIFAAVHSAVLMSGTLRPPEMARDLLGLDPARTAVRSYPSPFDPAKRPVHVHKGASTRFGERGSELWERLAHQIARTAAACKGNVAVFTPSYAILRELVALVDAKAVGKPIVAEQADWTKAERDQVLDTLEGARAKGGAILFGVLAGSFSEGVDFKGNLLSAVVVVGLPLAPPDLETDAAIAHLEGRLPGKGRLYAYTYPAMNKVLQAMGRGIRGPDDRCAVLLLDDRYLAPPYRQLLPGDAVVLPSDDPAAAVAPWLKGQGL